ncbi:uncharacterized protein [Dysidea avara]|uniref:uncharacterized protein n=1 Tax=Dysidea avara TaxID=196820 RepID=UPI00332E46BE
MSTDQVHADKYVSTEVELYSVNNTSEPTKQAFFFPTIKKYLSSEAPGKKVLDIGCGTGDWTKYAAECGAKSVDGFDISEEMVELSKQATAGLINVTICVGDATNMTYGNNRFDIALSFYITCVLHKEAFTTHFTELHRVLVPGGKAVVLNLARSAFDVMFLKEHTDQVMVEKNIKTALETLPRNPTNQQINEALADLHDVVLVTFTLDSTGHLYRVTDVNQLTNGQVVWIKTQIMVFPDYYYSADYINEQIKTAGLSIDYIEHYFTEERRISYNNSKPRIKLERYITEDPPFLLYHLSKSSN